MTYDEAQARIRELLRPYSGCMDRETAIQGILDSGPLRPVCHLCGSQTCDVVTECRHPFDGHTCPGGEHARDREDYLVEECAAAEQREPTERAQMMRQTLMDLKSVLCALKCNWWVDKIQEVAGEPIT